MPMITRPPIRTHRLSRRRRMSLSNVGMFVLIGFTGLCFAMALGSANAMGTHSAADFVKKASVGNEFEVESSQLALQKSQDENIRHFAQQMIDDHGKAGEDLATATSQANMEAPDSSLDKKHQKMLDKLNADSGTDFNKDYIKAQVKAHNEAVSLFKDYSKHGDNDSIKSFASTTLPTLQEHKQAIDQLNSSYKSN
jgi:putative membrane protein